MGAFDHFPYTNFHELNLEWILLALKEIQRTMEDFVSLNAIKYADPIQWNITKQYEKNTIVIDPLTGTAYISVRPVPEGAAITDTDYWTVVFDLGQFVVKMAQNLANVVEPETTLTATVTSSFNDWIIWGDVLYRNINPSGILAGDAYVVGSNIEAFTVEDVVGHIQDLTTADKSNLVAAVNELVTSIGDLSTLTTTDKTSLVNAANEILSTFLSTVGDLNDLTTSVKTSVVDAINSLQLKVDNLKLYNVKDYGAVGDGVTDDTQAIIDCISDNGGAYFPPGTYIISSTIFLDTNQYIVGSQGMDSIIKAAAGSNANVIKSLNFDAERGTDDHNNDQHNITIAYITIDGNYREHPEINTSIGNIINSTGTGVSLYAGGINMLNVNIINCGDDGLYTEWGSYLNTYIIPDGMESVYHNVVIKCCGRHGWEFQGSHDSIISQCVIATNNRKDDGCHNLYVAKSNFKMVNCHLYSDYGAPKVTTSLYVETAADPLMIVDSDIEGGGSTNMILLSSRNLFVNCRFYASFGANDMYIVNSTAKYNMFVGCMCGDQVTEPGVPQPTWHGAVEFGAADEVLSFFELLLSDTPACIYHSAHAHSIWRLVGYNTKLQISGQYDALPDPLTDPNWDEEDISIVGTFDTQSHYVYNTNAYVASYVASYLASFVRTNEVRYDSVSNAYKYYDGSNWIIPDEYVKYDPNESQFKFYGSGTWYIPTGAVRYNFTHIQAWDGSTWVDILSL